MDLPPILLDGGDVRAGRSPFLFTMSVAAATCCLLGCLPTPGPPVGQQVVRDRTLSNVFLSPSETDGVPSYLAAFGPERLYYPGHLPPGVYQAATFASLYLFPYASSPPTVADLSQVQAADDSLLVAFDQGGGYRWSYVDSGGGVMPSDYRGFLWYDRWNLQSSWATVQRLDPCCGSNGDYLDFVLSFTPGDPFLVPSPVRNWVYAQYRLWDLDPSLIDPAFGTDPMPIRDGSYCNGGLAFIGDDFYCGWTDPGGAESVVTRVHPTCFTDTLYSSDQKLKVDPILGDRAPQLLLTLTPQDATGFVLLDTQSLQTTRLLIVPAGANFRSASDDGHWLLFQSVATNNSPLDKLMVLDWTSGQHETIDMQRLGRALGDFSSSPLAEWRPGHEELWFPILPTGFAVWKPDGTVSFFDRTLVRYAQSPGGRQSIFTRDGRHWFSQDADQPGRVAIGLADEPGSPVFFLNPSGTGTFDYWQLDDGRLLVEAAPIDTQRSDIYVADPDTGASHALASAGHVVALGHTRFLALLDWELERSDGKLALVDLSKGSQTVFAEDVYAVAVDRGKSAMVLPGTDTLAPGTRIAYLTRGRLESPYDGLWVAELP